MGKWEQILKAVKDPPPERLAAIEYRSHMLNILGVMMVSIILIYKGFWYIIFAFIFGTGVSYSQMVGSYRKYLAIREFNPMKYPSIEKDPSPTRKRSRIINEALGSNIKWLISIISVIVSLFIINPSESGWAVKAAYPLLVMFIWILIYYFPTFWIANMVYENDKKLKGGRKNAKEKRRRD